LAISVTKLKAGGFIQMAAKVLILAVSMSILATVPMLAHHSFGAEYDAKKPLKFADAVVTKIEWTNPHARFYVDIKDANGKVENWNFELASPNVLKRNGWTRNTLKEGDHIGVEGAAAKDGARMGNAQRVTLPDGKRVFAGSNTDGQ
jgi:Family of unknown function (DUF6152)